MKNTDEAIDVNVKGWKWMPWQEYIDLADVVEMMILETIEDYGQNFNAAALN